MVLCDTQYGICFLSEDARFESGRSLFVFVCKSLYLCVVDVVVVVIVLLLLLLVVVVCLCMCVFSL